MGLYRTGKCTSHQAGINPAIPVADVTVETPSGRTRELLKAPIDTGFSGFLLAPAELYAKL